MKGRSPRRQPPEVVGRMVLSGAPPGEDSQRLSLCTDTAFVELERDPCVGDVSWLSHSLTGESKKIVGEDVVLDSDGGMAFVTIGDGEPQWACELFALSLYESSSTQGLVVVRQGLDDCEDRPLFLNRVLTMVQCLSLCIPIGSTRAPVEVSVELVPLKRLGCRVYVHLHSVYVLLGLQKADHPSQWVHKRIGGWLTAVEKAQLQGHVAKPWSEHQQAPKGCSHRRVGRLRLAQSPCCKPLWACVLVAPVGVQAQEQGRVRAAR